MCTSSFTNRHEQKSMKKFLGLSRPWAPSCLPSRLSKSKKRLLLLELSLLSSLGGRQHKRMQQQDLLLHSNNNNSLQHNSASHSLSHRQHRQLQQVEVHLAGFLRVWLPQTSKTLTMLTISAACHILRRRLKNSITICKLLSRPVNVIWWRRGRRAGLPLIKRRLPLRTLVVMDSYHPKTMWISTRDSLRKIRLYWPILNKRAIPRRSLSLQNAWVLSVKNLLKFENDSLIDTMIRL